MLSLHTKQKHILYYCLAALAVIPVIVFAIQKILISYGVLAIDYQMPAGFNDQIFYNAIVAEFKNEFPNEAVPGDGLTDVQLAKITYLRYSGVNGNKVSDVSGLEKMTGLTSLDLEWNNISSIDLSHNTLVQYLNLEKNSLTSIDLSYLTQATSISVANNQLTTLDLSQNTNLKAIYAGYNELTALDLSHNMLLETVDLNTNAITELNLANRSQLKTINVGNNNLTALDISNNSALTAVDATFNAILTLNTTNDTALTRLELLSNSLPTIDLSTNEALVYLDVDTNPLSDIDLSHNPNLKTFRAVSDNFATLDFSHNLLLENLYVPHNLLTSIDLSANTKLKELEIYENQLTTLNLANNTLLESLTVRDNQLTSITMPNGDKVKQIEAQRNRLGALDLSRYAGLKKLIANDNQITTLDVSNNPALTTLEIHNNSITEMDISASPLLTSFKADNIPVKTIVNTVSDNGTQFSLADLRYLKTSQVINTTSDYSYNSTSKVLSILDSSHYVREVQVSSTTRGLSYKLLLPVTLLYDANGGAGAPEPVSCYPEFGVSTCNYTISNEEPTRDGYVFLGWATTASSQIVNVAKGSTYTGDGYATIYAVWSPIYTLSFDTRGGAPTIPNATCHPTNNIGASCNVTIPITAPTLQDHTFFGYSNVEGARNPDYLAGGSYTFAGGGPRTATIYAVWGTGESEWAGGQNYVKGETPDIVIIVDYPLSMLDKILIDGVEVPRSGYILDEENGRIVIKGSYLDTLPSGNHTIELIFTDGHSTDLDFTITVTEYPTPPDSGGVAEGGVNEDGDVELHLVTPKTDVASVTVNVYDHNGALVKTVDYDEPGNRVRLDVSDLPDGNYVIERIYKDADGNVLEVTTEDYVKRSGDETVVLDFEIQIDTTKLILIEVYNQDGNEVRFVRVDPETGTVYVHDTNGNLIKTIPNGLQNGQLIVFMDGLPTGTYDLKVYYLNGNGEVIKSFVINGIEYVAPEREDPDEGSDSDSGTDGGTDSGTSSDSDSGAIVVPDTGNSTQSDNSVIITGSIAGIVIIAIIAISIRLIMKSINSEG